jgi:hypothetical protein
LEVFPVERDDTATLVNGHRMAKENVGWRTGNATLAPHLLLAVEEPGSKKYLIIIFFKYYLFKYYIFKFI